MSENATMQPPTGQLALVYCGVILKVQVLRSNAGFYIGTENDGLPVSRESAEYFATSEQATQALRMGQWTQRSNP